MPSPDILMPNPVEAMFRTRAALHCEESYALATLAQPVGSVSSDDQSHLTCGQQPRPLMKGCGSEESTPRPVRVCRPARVAGCPGSGCRRSSPASPATPSSGPPLHSHGHLSLFISTSKLDGQLEAGTVRVSLLSTGSYGAACIAVNFCKMQYNGNNLQERPLYPLNPATLQTLAFRRHWQCAGPFWQQQHLMLPEVMSKEEALLEEK